MKLIERLQTHTALTYSKCTTPIGIVHLRIDECHVSVFLNQTILLFRYQVSHITIYFRIGHINSLPCLFPYVPLFLEGKTQIIPDPIGPPTRAAAGGGGVADPPTTRAWLTCLNNWQPLLTHGQNDTKHIISVGISRWCTPSRCSKRKYGVRENRIFSREFGVSKSGAEKCTASDHFAHPPL